MPKKIVIPNSLEHMKRLVAEVDGFIIGVKDLSVNLPFYVDNIEDVVEYLNQANKEIFISLNKNIHNSDLNYLKETLLKLDKLNITAVIYYDASVVRLKKEIELGFDLVWGQEHMSTNYLTGNYWYDHGANYMLVSNDVTINEIVEISKKIKSKIMVPLFGYIPIFNSRRHLVENYLKTFGLYNKSKNYLIEKEGKSYNIVDDEHGTAVYSANILNGIGEYLTLENNNIDYIILNSYRINEDDFIKVVKLFNDVNISNIEAYTETIDSMFDNVDRGFLYTETVYKVKSNE